MTGIYILALGHCMCYTYSTCLVWPVFHQCFLLLLLSAPPLFVSPLHAASRFPQCSANLTTKMADAMEEYEKEAGCVPILHPEVWSLDFMSSHRHTNIYKTHHTRLCAGGCGGLPCFFRNSDAPCRNNGGGWQEANDANGANESPPPLPAA